MKSYNNLFEKVVSIDNIKLAIYKASKGKRTRKDVLAVNMNIDNEAKKIREMLISDEYTPTKNTVHMINEDSNMKVRKIRKPHFAYDQIVHHAVIQVLKPIFLKGMYRHTCGSVPKRGAHSGKKRIDKWIRNDIKNTRYCFKCDIRHFYASIDKDILKSMLDKKIRDKRMVNLLFKIIDSCDDGIPIGYYTSPWFVNFYLQGLDHYIKQELHAKYFIRYADDIVIFGSNKRVLHTMQRAIEMYLAVKIHLRMKKNWQVFKVEYKPEKRKEQTAKPKKRRYPDESSITWVSCLTMSTPLSESVDCWQSQEKRPSSARNQRSTGMRPDRCCRTWGNFVTRKHGMYTRNASGHILQ